MQTAFACGRENPAPLKGKNAKGIEENKMAIFSLNVSMVKRSTGGSAVATASYIEDRTLRDSRLGRTFRYGHDETEKHTHTVRLGSRLADGTEIDTGLLWNHAEFAENRKNSQTARKIMIALPRELDQETHRRIIDKFRKDLERSYGVATTAAIHYEHEHNPHCHILITTRQVSINEEKNLIFGAKTRVLDDQKTGSHEIERIREVWEQTCNNELEKEHQISRLSYERQKILKSPQIHLGMVALRMERQGKKSIRADWYYDRIKTRQYEEEIIRRLEDARAKDLQEYRRLEQFYIRASIERRERKDKHYRDKIDQHRKQSKDSGLVIEENRSVIERPDQLQIREIIRCSQFDPERTRRDIREIEQNRTNSIQERLNNIESMLNLYKSQQDLLFIYEHRIEKQLTISQLLEDIKNGRHIREERNHGQNFDLGR